MRACVALPVASNRCTRIKTPRLKETQNSFHVTLGLFLHQSVVIFVFLFLLLHICTMCLLCISHGCCVSLRAPFISADVLHLCGSSVVSLHGPSVFPRLHFFVVVLHFSVVVLHLFVALLCLAALMVDLCLFITLLWRQSVVVLCL